MPRKGSFTPNNYRIEENIAYLELTLGQEAMIDVSDLEKALKYRWYAMKRNDIKSYYVLTHNRTNGSAMYLHRYLMDAPDHLEIDHWNHNGLDNQRKNLRVVTIYKQRENLRGSPKTSRLGIRGISAPILKKKQGGKYTYWIYRFRCACKGCPVYKEFPATAEGLEAARTYAEVHYAAMKK